MMTKLLTRKEAAQRLRISPGGLLAVIHRDQTFPRLTVDRRKILVPEDKLEAWLEARLTGGEDR